MYKMNAETELTPLHIQKFLMDNLTRDSRQKKLYDYYVGKNAIMKRTMNDSTKPNNKVATSYGNFITTMYTGYFMGEPIKYTCENEEQLEVIKAIMNYNDEAENDVSLAKDSSIFGVSYELLYLDMDAQIRFKKVDTRGCIPIFENNIEGDLLYFIRSWVETDILTSNVVTYVDVYSRKDIKHYRSLTGALELLGVEPHSWGIVPVCIYWNNEDELGDFETVIPLIDAYDVMESDSVNEMESFSDCYLVLKGVEGTTAEDIKNMKENRVLSLPVDADSAFMTKSINDSYLENEKTRIDGNIHKMSYCPNLTDKEFAGNASGVAIKYKCLGFENACAKKESSFKKGIQRRLELICGMLNLMGSNYDYRAINIIFTRNLPSNITEMADVATKLSGLYSDKTLMSIIPIETDYVIEQAQKQQEEENSAAYEFVNFGSETTGDDLNG